jgi:hypothetical protein
MVLPVQGVQGVVVWHSDAVLMMCHVEVPTILKNGVCVENGDFSDHNGLITRHRPPTTHMDRIYDGNTLTPTMRTGERTAARRGPAHKSDQSG